VKLDRLLLALSAAVLLASPRTFATARFPVVDLHVDLPWQTHLKGRSLELTKGHVTRRVLLAGHYLGVVLPLFVPQDIRADGPREEDLEAMFHTVERMVWSPLLPFSPVRKDGPTVSGWLSFEGADAFAARPSAIAPWVSRGVRLVGLGHLHDGPLAGSSTGAKRGGLSEQGREVARAALDAGALLDVSHLSDASFDDVAALCRDRRAPIVASHSNARAVADHPRNLTDAELRAIGESGGIVGLNLHAPYLGGGGDPPMAQLVRQLDHLVAVAGEDHVGIGSDFDGGIRPPSVLSGPERFPALAQALLDHGWMEPRVKKVFSENALRLLSPAAAPP
jgi:membrane dipeptidase